MTNYYKIDDTHELEIQIRYTLGGVNPLNYREEKRGYYLHLDVVTRDGSWIKRQMHTAIDGVDIKTGKILLKPVNRKNNNTYNRICAELDFEKVNDIWQANKYEDIFDYIRTLKI